MAEGRYLSDELTLHYGLVPAHQPRHLRHQRAARPRRAHPGRPAQRARGARRPGPRLQDPPAARRAARRVGQPRGLHEPRPHHHAAEGPLRQPDPHALPARRRHRGRHHAPGGPPVRRRWARECTCPTTWPRSSPRSRQLARQSPHVNQRSGVSVRLSVSNYEVLAANALRRALRAGERDVVPRVSDLEALAASTSGKIEIEIARGGPRGPDRREPREGARSSRCSRTASRPTSSARSSPRSTRDSSPTPARTCSSADEAELLDQRARAARAGAQLTDDEIPGGGRQRGRVRPRGPAPVEAPEQGRRGRRATYRSRG